MTQSKNIENYFPMNLRRKRLNEKRRDLFSQVNLMRSNLIYPLFIQEGLSSATPLPSLYGQERHTLESLLKKIESCREQGQENFLLFMTPSEKKERNFDYTFDTQVISKIKETFGKHINLFVDLCLCPQTSTGHCGLFTGDESVVDNNLSVKAIVEKGIYYAQAGTDCISPSDMMDDRILALRQGLNQRQLSDTLIMSYSTKFASNFYGPFRDAADSTPKNGDRQSYQISYRNPDDALSCSLRDAEQGADILMVKPAGPYQDMIYRIKHHPKLANIPLAAYQVSGEYQGLKLMDQAGHLNFEKALTESLIALKRSGADLMITYGAMELSL